MWPFRKKTIRDRDRVRARRDNTSLGNLLLKSGMITPDELRMALEYQDQNPERMLGEALVRLGAVEKEIIEALLAMQEIEDGKTSPRALAKVVHLAKNRKKPLHDAHDRMVQAALCLNGD